VKLVAAKTFVIQIKHAVKIRLVFKTSAVELTTIVQLRKNAISITSVYFKPSVLIHKTADPTFATPRLETAKLVLFRQARMKEVTVQTQ
jgi:hypothetical protein